MIKKPYRIVIVEDHRILREGLNMILSSNNNVNVVGEADNGLDGIRCVNELKPDLVLLDLSMPKMNGLDAISEIKIKHPDIRIMILTHHKTEEYVFEALKAGADGYVLKDATRVELLLAVENILEGKKFISPGVSGNLVSGYLEGKKPLNANTSLNSLTQREKQILKLIAEGHKNRAIADLLCISIKTVEKHRANLMKKLSLHNVSELTTFAIEKGMVTL